MTAAEVLQRLAVHHGAVGRPESALEDFLRVRPGHGVHRVEQHAEPAVREQGAQRIEVEQPFHELGVVRDGIDHGDAEVAELVVAIAVEVNVRRVDRAVFRDLARPLRDHRRHLLRRWATVGEIVFHPEVPVRPAGVVARRQDDPAVSFPLANHA